MTGLFKKAVLGTALAASALTAAAPASAQYGWYRGGYRHHDGIGAGGAAVLGGLLGLGVGAAIASSNNNRYRDRGYYDDGYYRAPPRVIYRERFYAPPRVIYRGNPYRDGYYGRGYYPRGYYGY